jgi:hypothetical protein
MYTRKLTIIALGIYVVSFCTLNIELGVGIKSVIELNSVGKSIIKAILARNN